MYRGGRLRASLPPRSEGLRCQYRLLRRIASTDFGSSPRASRRPTTEEEEKEEKEEEEKEEKEKEEEVVVVEARPKE
jgi:hypothetical protein